MTVEQVADYLQLNKLTVYKYIREGRLPAARLGKGYRIRSSDVEAFLERQMLRSAPGPGAGAPASRARASPVPATRAPAPGSPAGRVPAGRPAAPRVIAPAEVAVGPARPENPREREPAEVSINPMEWVIRGLH